MTSIQQTINRYRCLAMERQASQGQALVLFALALTVLIGFVALSVDAGFLMAERRQVQAAADAGAMAAAVAMRENKDAQQHGYQAHRWSGKRDVQHEHPWQQQLIVHCPRHDRRERHDSIWPRLDDGYSEHAADRRSAGEHDSASERQPGFKPMYEQLHMEFRVVSQYQRHLKGNDYPFAWCLLL